MSNDKVPIKSTTNTRPPQINIIGAGRLGQTLAHLWRNTGQIAIQQLLTRSRQSAQQACDFIGGGQACDQLQQMQAAELWLIATPDGQIAETASALLAAKKLRSGDTVFHCSGALSSELLSALTKQGAAVASVHPIHSFATPSTSTSTFSGSHCACEGDEEAIKRLQPLFSSIGG